MTGGTGGTGAVGATGANGGIDAAAARWLNLTLANSVTARSGADEEFPACFPDINGQVYLRGHLSLSPVPATGGSLLAIFPRDHKGECSCTPRPDAGTMGNEIIVTTTAIAYPVNRPNIPDVCVVRLLISQSVPVDVNRDLVVNETDIALVKNSTYYTFDILSPSMCPIVNNQRICGRADVNFDGYVNQLDATAISQSANVTDGTDVMCGGVFATTFSCGSSRSAPLTPAVDISFDSIVYFNNDGEYASTSITRKRGVGAADVSMLRTILVDYEKMQTEIVVLKSETTALKSENIALSAKLDSEVRHLDGEVKHLSKEFVSHDQEIKHYRSSVQSLQSEVKQHEKTLRNAVPAERRDVAAGASIAVAGVVFCAAVALFLAKRR